MKERCIFDGQLYSLILPGEDCDEFEKLFDLWQDINYLRVFFTEHVIDLERFYKMTVDEAIEITLEEADIFEDSIFDRCDSQPNTLDQIFRPLDNNTYSAIPLRKSKARGPFRQSWLRIYAIRIDSGLFVITGGAIKLTERMEQRNHTNEELKKLKKYRDCLKDRQIDDADSFFEINI